MVRYEDTTAMLKVRGPGRQLPAVSFSSVHRVTEQSPLAPSSRRWHQGRSHRFQACQPTALCPERSQSALCSVTCARTLPHAAAAACLKQ